MTNQEILTKAIEKAIAGGWQVFANPESDEIDVRESMSLSDWMGYEVSKFPYVNVIENGSKWHMADIIFNHDFAKALWREEWEDLPFDNERIRIASREQPQNYIFEGTTVNHVLHRTGNKGWQYHLQQMVIADDPIAYLEEHL